MKKTFFGNSFIGFAYVLTGNTDDRVCRWHVNCC